MRPLMPSDSGAVPKRVVLIQLAILVSLAAFYALYLPYREKSRAAAEVEERELRIEALFQSLVVEDTSREVLISPSPDGEMSPSGGKARAHPQKLTRLPMVGEVEQELGLPDRRATDFRSGLHLTWKGSQHSLEASFDQGRLYCLRREDLRTGHGALVFESSTAWHPF